MSEKTKKAKPDYHFEKITKNANKFFESPGFAPSGIKGALVVNKNEADMLKDVLPRITDRYELH